MNGANPTLDTKWSLLFSGAAACLVAVALAFFAVTPRGRLNVMQGAAAVFYITLLFRLFRTRGAPAADSSGGSFLLPALSMIAAVWIWTRALDFYFINDDFGLLMVTRPFSRDLLWSFFRDGTGDVFFRPLTYATFAVDQAFWGPTPSGFHFTNLLLHALSTAGLFMIVTQLGESRGAAFMTAGIFAAMPIQVESVSWMAGRFDVLSTTLGVWSVVTYLWVRARGGNARYAVALAVFALAICAKETAFVLPVLMAAIEILVFRNFPIRRLSGFAITGAVMFAYRWWTLGGFGGYRSDGASTMIGLGWKTLEALFLRGPSVTLFGFNWLQPSGSFAVVAVVAAALAIFIVVAAPLTERRRRILQMSLVWMVVAMIPGHFLLSIGAGLSNSRILCLASAGMALLLGQLVSATPQRYARNLAYAALVTVFGLGVTHNLGAWRWTSSIGEETLRQVVRMEPSPPPNAQFVISNMPRSLRGVFFFGAGLNEGFQTAYNRGDIAAYRDSAASTEHPEIRLKWTGENDGLIQRE